MALTTIQGRPSPAGPTPPHFGFAGAAVNALAATAQVIDSNPLINLMTLDLGGMVLPRTFLEFRERGIDMGRETFLRESMGTVTNVFLAGWTGGAALAIFKGAQAARGAQAAPWINWRTMEHYSALLDRALSEGVSAQDARERFVRAALQSLRANDSALAPQLLRAAVSGVENPTLRAALTARVDAVARNRLSPQGVDALTTMLAPSETPDRGVYHIGKMTAQWRHLQSQYAPHQHAARTALAQGHALSAAASHHPDAAHALKMEDMLRASNDRQWAVETARSARHAPVIAKELARHALEDGMSPSIHAVDVHGKPFLKDRSLETTLGELRTFLEQYVDRALSHPVNGDISAQALDEATRGRIRAALFNKARTRSENGLITLARLNRRWLTTLPLALTVIASTSVAFLNNWLTRKKHHGQVFFPGEGGPRTMTSVAASARGINARPASPFRAANDSVFDVFQARRPSGLRAATGGGA
ncbi:MAG: hypothetical protein IPK79_08115 [Vampirovibrionales bacterium]|nr:hypothetical protein [Vampirovibrionales bacterium]